MVSLLCYVCLQSVMIPIWHIFQLFVSISSSTAPFFAPFSAAVVPSIWLSASWFSVSAFLVNFLILIFWTNLSSPFHLRKYLKFSGSKRSGNSSPGPSKSRFSPSLTKRIFSALEKGHYWGLILWHLTAMKTSSSWQSLEVFHKFWEVLKDLLEII